MTRWNVAGKHLLISLLIGAVLAYLLYRIWYPGSLFQASGGDFLILLLIGIDVAAGPLLTLIVYRQGKRGMAFDMGAIAFAQLAFLAYGLNVIAASRPAFVVFVEDRFIVVSASAISAEDLALSADPAFQIRGWRGPRTVAVELPESAEERTALMLSGLQGKDAERFPKYFRAYEEGAPRAAAAAHPVERLARQSDAAAAEVAAIQTRHAGRSVGYLPLLGRTEDLVMLLDRQSGEILGQAHLNPWQDTDS